MRPVSGNSDSSYLGIVIEQSQQDKNIAAPARLVARKIVNTWAFLLVHVAGTALDEHIGALQANMVADGSWYAHYFRGKELVVVFRDAVFKVSLDQATWGPVIQYGLKKGIPVEQLDFKPATRQDAEEFFGLGNSTINLKPLTT
jgi:hypothetical protein